jgi:hypothetical protein
MPRPAEIEVAAWPAPNTSYSDSFAHQEAGRAALLPDVPERLVAPGQDLVRIALVADVPDELVRGVSKM